MNRHRWAVAETNEADILSLQQSLKINPVLCRLLNQRGIKTYEEAKIFFRPSLDHLHDPFLMKDMDKAVNRIITAMQKGEKIMVYGDYDVDGTTSVALVYSFFKNLYDKIDFYIPDRYKEGYGISYGGIDWAAENNFSLIIALDCGIKSLGHIAYANKKGVDFIICDHHLPGAEIPKAFAVLNPKRNDCLYPYKELSGCGVGFKLLQAFSIQNNIPLNDLFENIDIVAISIAADIVPVTGENRVLAFHGLQILNTKLRPGLKILLEMSGFKGKALTISDVVFIIAPRINAAGRIDDAKGAVNMMIAKNDEDARKYAGVLNTQNDERKGYDKSITEEALEILKTDQAFFNRKSTVIFRPHWHKGVIGIVASRLIEQFYRPTIVLTESNGKATGSARSVNGFDLYTAIESCADLLEQFGGHTHAAGLTLKMENLEAFTQKFEEVVSGSIKDEHLQPCINIDAVLELESISPSFINIINQMAPFGPGNMRPVFVTKQVKNTSPARLMKEEHLKLHINKNFSKISCIGFKMKEYYPLFQDNTSFDICYSLEENEWQEQKTIELRIRDIKFETAMAAVNELVG